MLRLLENSPLVDDAELADRLESAYGSMTRVLALTIPAGDDHQGARRSAGRARGTPWCVLLCEHVWPQRQGL